MRFVVKGLLPFLLLAFGSVFSLTMSSAQSVTTQSATPSPAEIERIIQVFTTKETQFRKALVAYAFKRDALIQEVGMGGQVVGEYHRVSHFTFDDAGNKFEKIDYFPMASFEGVTQEDLEDLGGINPYALDSSKAALYDFRYIGKERIDELDLHVFDVSPKVMPDPKKIKDRLFLGRIWVDDRDLQIVKSKGKGVPETKINKFPYVETYREQIDGKYWFPTYSYADEELVYDAGNVLRIRLRVKYSDYAQARGKLRITDMEGEAPDAKPRPSPSPKGSTKEKPQEN